MKLNVNKTKVLFFNRDDLYPDIDLRIDHQKVEVVQCFKFLGVHLDASLSFQHHFKLLHDKLCRSTYIIQSLSRFLPSICLHIMYFAYYHSHILYCLHIWYPLLSTSFQDCLYKVQKRVIRSLCNASFNQHCMPLFKSQRILTVKDLLFVENTKFIFRLQNNLCPNPISLLFDLGSSTVNTRGRKLLILKHTTAKVNKSFLCKSFID